jgi:hypothetical protein
MAARSAMGCPAVRSRCRWRVGPTTRRAFPAPRSHGGPCPNRRPASRSRRGAASTPDRGDRPSGDPTTCPAPRGRRGRVTCATPKSATSTGSRGATGRPFRPCPAARTRREFSPCTPRCAGAVAAPWPEPLDPDLSVLPRHQHGRASNKSVFLMSIGDVLPRPLYCNSTNQVLDLPRPGLTQREGPARRRQRQLILLYGRSSNPAEDNPANNGTGSGSPGRRTAPLVHSRAGTCGQIRPWRQASDLRSPTAGAGDVINQESRDLPVWTRGEALR